MGRMGSDEFVHLLRSFNHLYERSEPLKRSCLFEESRLCIAAQSAFLLIPHGK